MPQTKEFEFLTRPVTAVKGVTPRRAALLARCGISTLWDALTFFPYRYEDFSEIKRPDQVKAGEEALVYGKVLDVKAEKTFKKRLKIVKVLIENSGGKASGVWFNQPWLAEKFEIGKKVLFHGVCHSLFAGCVQMTNPDVIYLDDDFHPDDYEGKKLPVYHTTEGLPQGVLRKVMSGIVSEALPNFREYLPYEERRKHGLIDISDAVAALHDPKKMGDEELGKARRRLIVDEFFALQVGNVLTKKIMQKENYEAHHLVPGKLIVDFLNTLPFKLTKDQLSVLSEIKNDMLAPRPMHRLLQGDVGSGKTVVAATAMLMAVESGYNAAIMAPTEILARQHFETLKKWCDKIGVDVLFSHGGMKAKEKKELLNRFEEEKNFILVGTHSLLHVKDSIPNLGLVVIDEQHKFGVAQRAMLREAESVPDTLIMTATPIPRSLAMTLYGHLDISVIRSAPAGRIPVKTYVVTPERLPGVWDFIRKEAAAGRQAYIVYPQIDESDKREAKAAAEMFDVLSKKVFPDLKLGIVHGRLEKEEKEETMRRFREGEISVLICTTVIEVGVDVPNASVMVIEDAQRFGLAQLHQLRGRIGRGSLQSYCVLVDNTPLEKGGDEFSQPLLTGMTENRRLEVMAKTCDGFEIAEADMELRGPGEFFGEKQSGHPTLYLANPNRDRNELSLAKELAEKLIEAYDKGDLAPDIREAFLTRVALRYGEEFTMPGF
ncbi:ATP-dependent DNA helicase RecG [bacterium]|nr:ATP-dependent DNA helicase RecG [bacterium]